MKKSQHENVPRPVSGRKAVALFSGGLDSILAAVLVERLGVEVLLLHVQHLWSGGEAARRRIEDAAARAGLKLRIVDGTEDHLCVIRHPRHGYGTAVNPCVDCHIFMLQVAKRVMEEEDADFVVTGEVLGQRPKSQHYRALCDVAEESGLGDRLLRPLSANLLPETLPVREGWLSREDLLSLHGRGREAQMLLAERLGIREFPQPAGGCLLTEKAYGGRVFDAFEHFGRDAVDRAEFEILRVGRHFRLSPQTKVVVGRDEEENSVLAARSPGRVLIEPADVMGPTSLVEGNPTEDEIELAAALAARYCDHEGSAPLAMSVTKSGMKRTLSVRPLDSEDSRLREWRIEDRPRRRRTPPVE